MKTPALSLLRALALFSVLCTAAARSQSDDFNDLNDTGWDRYQPLADLGAATASFTFTGGVYRIASAESQSAPAGPARAGSTRPEIYSTFCVMVDLVDWNPAEDSSFGLLARIDDPGLGTTNGYAFTYQGQDHDVQISRITGEIPTSLSGSPAVTLTPGGDYRMVFFGIGGQLEGRIYNMADPLVPLVTATGNDLTYTSGKCGLVVFSDSNSRTSAGFDNYLANDGKIAPPTLTIGGGELELTWDVESGLAHTLESSIDLASWFPLTTLGAENGKFLYYEPFGGFSPPAAHFRLRLGAPPAIGAAQ